MSDILMKIKFNYYCDTGLNYYWSMNINRDLFSSKSK